jgi:signal transduction histidine kinase
LKLLTYSSKKYLWSSSIIVLISIPLFYVVVNSLLLNFIDQNLNQDLKIANQKLSTVATPLELENWLKYNPQASIQAFQETSFNPQPFNKEIYNLETKTDQSYRVKQQKVTVFKRQFILSVKTSLFNSKNLLKSILIIQLALLIILFIVFQIITRSISKKIWQPFNQILNFLKAYDIDKPSALQTEILGIEEFNELNKEINSLIARTQQSYTIQKEFTENAAHELQTPVAIIKSKLDLFLQDPQLSNSQAKLLQQINYVLQKLADLNKNLLLLSKIENQQFALTDKVNVNQLLQENIENLNFFAQANYQQLIYTKPVLVNLNGSKNLSAQLIQNLLINAIQYGSKGTLIHILLTENSLTFINEGAPLPFSQEQLFSRFSKTIQNNQNGNGLGLSIAYQIAKAQGFDLTYQYLKGKHHFQIDFTTIPAETPKQEPEN